LCLFLFSMSFHGSMAQDRSSTPDVVCKEGDGIGSQEVEMTSRYTKAGCIAAVKQKHPNANGATFVDLCNGSDGKCTCYAEYGMTDWKPSTTYKSCKYSDDLPLKYNSRECKIGKGIGGSLSVELGRFTEEDCIKKVKELGPPANGATFVNPCNGPDGKCSCYAKYGMKEWNNSKMWITCKFSEEEEPLTINIDGMTLCKTGDASVGTHNEELDGRFTEAGCIAAVKQEHPDANGATFENPCNGSGGKCRCFANFGMEGWNNNKKWITCKF